MSVAKRLIEEQLEEAEEEVDADSCYVAGCTEMGRFYLFVGEALELTGCRHGYLCDRHAEELNWIPECE